MTLCAVFPCTILTSNNTTSLAIWCTKTPVNFSKTINCTCSTGSNNFVFLKKFTHAYRHQITLKITLLPLIMWIGTAPFKNGAYWKVFFFAKSDNKEMLKVEHRTYLKLQSFGLTCNLHWLALCFKKSHNDCPLHDPRSQIRRKEESYQKWCFGLKTLFLEEIKFPTLFKTELYPIHELVIFLNQASVS